MDGNLGAEKPTDAKPTTTVRTVPPGLEPPVQKNENGRPAVTFDPCLDFEDAVMRSAGLDPASRERIDIIGESTTLGCGFDGAEFVARVDIGNWTFEESLEDFRDRIRERLLIGSRDAFMGASLYDPANCAIVVRMREGAMLISVDPRLEAKRAGKDGCTFAPEIARALEPSLPKDR